MFERAWYLFTVPFLHTLIDDPNVGDLTLWKAISQGAYRHPNDDIWNNFYMFYAYSPIAFDMLQDGCLEFNHQDEIPSVTIQ